MDLGTRDVLLTVGAALLLVGGVALVVGQNATLGTLGIVMIIASAVVFLVDVKDLLVKSDDHASE